LSFDLGVWFPKTRISNDEARDLYVCLCAGDASGVVPHPAIAAFYAELTKKHPEPGTLPEGITDHPDDCPWSCRFDHTPSYVLMSCIWPQATRVHALVKDLTRKHGLALYDPQSEKVVYPDGSTGAGATASRPSLWGLAAFSWLFAAMFLYTARVSSSGTSVVFYVFAGLSVLMGMACVRQAFRK
jgi:hypothetical protein